MSASPRKKALLVLIVAVAAGAVVYHRTAPRRRAAAAPAAPRLASVKAYRVRPQKITGFLMRNGTVRPQAETNLQFGAAGRIVKFEVEKGQFVRKGAVIAELDQAEAKSLLQAAEIDFQRASMKYFQDRTIDKLEFERARLRYEQARRDFEKTLIRAPHAGYLIDKFVPAGEHVDAGTVVGKLMDKTRVFVEMSLTEQDMPFVKLGQEVEVTVDAASYRGGGRVKSITPYLEGATRSFAVKVSLPENPGEALNPGMFARCTVHRYEKDKALTVPAEAALEGAGSQVRVFTLDPQGRVHLRSLPVLFSNEKKIEVGNVAEGDLVVVSSPVNLKDGEAVELAGVFDPEVEAEETEASRK